MLVTILVLFFKKHLLKNHDFLEIIKKIAGLRNSWESNDFVTKKTTTF